MFARSQSIAGRRPNPRALTFGVVAKRKAWRAFLARVQGLVTFLHRDELRDCLGTRDIPVPPIRLGRGYGALQIFVCTLY
jgi:hypothetical protein